MVEPRRAIRQRAPTRARSLAPPLPQTPTLGEAPEDGIVEREAVQLLSDPRLRSHNPAQRARLLQRLQGHYGNAEIARLIQRAAVADAPASPQKLDPHQDPRFLAVEHKVTQTAAREKQHPSARSKAAEAQAAAHGPPDDVASQAAVAELDRMAQQKPGEFDKKAFVEAVKKAIDAAAPKNLEEVTDFKSSDKAGQVKAEVAGLVGKGKQQSEAGIKQANTEAPDASRARPKPVAPMPDEKPGSAPTDVGAAQAIPSPKTAAETSMAAGPAEVNQQMAQASVTEEQLKQSDEPQFTDALAAKKTAEEHSQKAPEVYHATENQVLAKAGGDAKGAAGAALQGMHAGRAGALGGVTAHKGGAKAQDEAKRAEISAKIETLFNQTRTEVSTILDGLETKVSTTFDGGEKAARDQFETYVDQRMSAYKDDRYSGLIGKGRWVHDKLMGMPSEVNAFYQEGRTRYLAQMQTVIGNAADLVGAELGRARARIAQGRQQVKEYVASQPKHLQQVARDAEREIAGKFDQLEGDVNSKQDSLVQSLADKYVAARDALDQRIDQLKAENKGLVDAVKDAIGGVIQTIMHLKDMLLNVLQKAAGVIGDIIRAPIKFLGNLVGAIKQGLNQFVSNIGTHLQKGLMGWLFGTLGDAGVQLPDSFDLKGILSLILQVLGLTYENVRAIAVKIAGEKVIGAVEGTVKFFMTLAKEGPTGLWEWIKDKIADLNIEDVVIGAIKDFVVTKIIMAGVTWLIGLLNPAAAFVKACKMIYDVIMFFVERGSQIMEFVNSILDGIGAIVSGSIGAAANLVESSLAKILPLAISFLASLLGVGGIAEKIKEIVEKIRAPITKLIGAVVGPLVRPLKKLYEKGAGFVKGVVDKGKALGKKALGKAKGLFGGSKPDAQAGSATAPVAHESFAAAGEEHEVTIKAGPDGKPAVTVASSPQSVAVFIAALARRVEALPEDRRPPLRARLEALRGAAFSVAMQQNVANAGALVHTLVAQLKQAIDLIGNGEQRMTNVAVASYSISVRGQSASGLVGAFAGPYMGEPGALTKGAKNQENRTLERAAVSGDNRVFGSFVVAGQPGEEPHVRHQDSEVKLLEHITSQILALSGTSLPFNDSVPDLGRRVDVTGVVHLTSEFVICPSCQTVIGKFRSTFPNVALQADAVRHPRATAN
jgi:hypothetical protein